MQKKEDIFQNCCKYKIVKIEQKNGWGRQGGKERAQNIPFHE